MTSSVCRKTFRFLTPSQIQRLHFNHIGPSTSQPSQPSMLESAAQSPLNIKHWTEEENLFQLGGHLSDKLIKNHAFQDGNKRTALAAAYMFLTINGFRLQGERCEQEGAANANDVIQKLTDAHVAVCTLRMTAEQLGDLYQSVAVERTRATTAAILAYRKETLEC